MIQEYFCDIFQINVNQIFVSKLDTIDIYFEIKRSQNLIQLMESNITITPHTSNIPTTDTILPIELCNPENCYRWRKGQTNVYACLITNENIKDADEFLKKDRENSNISPQIGKYVIYNPNIPESDGQVWMNKLPGYSKATSENSKFSSLHLSKDGLEFDEYIFIPKEKGIEEGVDTWVGFQIPKGKTFKIESGCGNHGSDESSAFATDWLPIVNGKFDWARSRGSMKQSNYICTGKEQIKIDDKCLQSWENSNL